MTEGIDAGRPRRNARRRHLGDAAPDSNRIDEIVPPGTDVLLHQLLGQRLGQLVQLGAAGPATTLPPPARAA
ncbi:hypothetical protein [Streptomyces yanii]|uniref:Uncharacterized protein n=1 Tax=Streptomyces yanii TaxID=78510 RepID=A0ABV5RK61_9ACTN